ncbi:helix-hairpin-helix domain-containing protein [Patescibacteria group bacterium]
MDDKKIRSSGISEETDVFKFNWDEIWKRYKAPISLGFVGLVLVGIGTLSILLLQQKEPEIEIIPLEEANIASTLFVDLEGAVEKPGVYELSSDARINDLLIRAGGLSAEADRSWVEVNLNLAQKLADGVKIYIPRAGEAPGGQVAGSSTSVTDQININTASAAQLDTLWGIGPSRAQDIINGRPYQAVEDLSSQKVIPSNVYEKIKDQLAVY